MNFSWDADTEGGPAGMQTQKQAQLGCRYRRRLSWDEGTEAADCVETERFHVQQSTLALFTVFLDAASLFQWCYFNTTR